MKQSKVKKHKARELDLLPVMSLFSILVTVVISMAQFEKLGILELWLPERGMAQANPSQDVDEGLLNLTVIVTDKSITVGAAAGFQPAVYYQEEVEYRSRSDQKVFRQVFVKGQPCDHDCGGVVLWGGEAGGQATKTHVDSLRALADRVHPHEPQYLDPFRGYPHATRWAIEPLP